MTIIEEKKEDKHSYNFKPSDSSCEYECPLKLRENEFLCCYNSRKCCFFCINNCRVSDEYHVLIQKIIDKID